VEDAKSEVKLIPFPKVAVDSRGEFLKLFSSKILPDFSVKEVFYSVTKRGFVRGMHLQVGSAANDRVIACLRGSIFDSVIDARVMHPKFGALTSFELSEQDRCAIFVPRGFAHGFQALTDDALVLYLSNNLHVESLDVGINPLTSQLNWPKVVSGVSERDRNLPSIEQYKANAS